MSKKIVLTTTEGYDRVNRRNAYGSALKKLTFGAPHWEENKGIQSVQEENKDRELASGDMNHIIQKYIVAAVEQGRETICDSYGPE